MNNSYDWYKVFCCVVQNGNITNAAAQLFISQPAVSQCIKQLESSLGCKLLIRTPKGVKATYEGEHLYRHIAKGIEQFEIGEKRLRACLNLDIGEIYIGASDMTLEYFLLPYLERFHASYPDIKVRITNGPTPETVRILEEDKIDFGIISEPAPEVENFDVIPVREIEDIFICGKEFAKNRVKNKKIENPAAFPLIMLEPNTSTRKHINNYFENNDIAVCPEFELATSSLIVQFVKRNLGVGCVVRDFAEEELDKGCILELKPEKPIPKRRICVIKKHTPCSLAAERLLEIILVKLMI